MKLNWLEAAVKEEETCDDMKEFPYVVKKEFAVSVMLLKMMVLLLLLVADTVVTDTTVASVLLLLLDDSNAWNPPVNELKRGLLSESLKSVSIPSMAIDDRVASVCWEVFIKLLLLLLLLQVFWLRLVVQLLSLLFKLLFGSFSRFCIWLVKKGIMIGGGKSSFKPSIDWNDSLLFIEVSAGETAAIDDESEDFVDEFAEILKYFYSLSITASKFWAN